MIELAICAPIPALRAGLRALINADPDLTVTADAACLDDLHGRVPESGLVVATPDAFPAGWETDLASALPTSDLAILMISEDAREARALLGFDLRAWGMVSPESSGETLQAAIHALAADLVAASPAVLQQLYDLPPSPLDFNGEEAEDALPVDKLTSREIDVLRCLAQGLTNKQIALELQISEHTVKFHVSSIYAKLRVSNRTEASRKGARLGIVPL